MMSDLMSTDPAPASRRSPARLALTLSGELDAYDAPALRAAFAEAPPAARRRASSSTSPPSRSSTRPRSGRSSGLLRRVREGGGELRVVLPETEARRIFELTALDRALDVRPSRESALAG